MPPDFLLHQQGGIEGALGMIFVGNGRAEEGEDAVAGGLSDVAFVAMHGIHHQLECRIDDGTRLFRIEAFNQSHRAFDVSEKRGDGLTLAVSRPACFHCRLLSPNALCEMRRCIARGSSGSSDFGLFFRLLPSRQGGAAFRAELGSWRSLDPAIRAAACQCNAALHTEFDPFWIVSPAAWTVHPGSFLNLIEP